MPKATTITKEMIINSAFEIVREKGYSALSARNITKKIGCSTQPIYWIYKNMEDLKQDVINKMIDFLNEILKGYKKSGKPFLDYGLGYVYIAHTEPVFFKAMYVDNILNIKMTDIILKKEMIDIMTQEAHSMNIPDDKIIEVAASAWLLAHGIASLTASGMIVYDEDQIEKMLDLYFEAMTIITTEV